MRPFRLTFKTDANEMTVAAAATTNELSVVPGGIIGFQLTYMQISC